VWGAAWDAARDAETPASDYVALVLGNIASETESTTIRTTLAQLVLVAKQYVAPERRTATIEKIGDTLWGLAQSAEAGSDAQFQFVKYFANVASTEQHVTVLRALLSGSTTLEGLEIDTDLSWELLEGLVLNGAAGDAEVDEALAKDKTANGQQAAARARATITTEAGKQAAFDSLVKSDKAPNAIVRNVTMGYTHVNDAAVLEAFVAPYFEAINDVWTNRSYAIAETVLRGLYPAPLANQGLVDATNAWLEANPEVPALRRIIVENLAGVERALVVQARDNS